MKKVKLMRKEYVVLEKQELCRILFDAGLDFEQCMGNADDIRNQSDDDIVRGYADMITHVAKYRKNVFTGLLDELI